METKRVYAAINAVTAAMATDGISKSRKNQQQGYQFRGIDDVYNALSRELANAKLCVLPRVLERGVVERETKNGGVLFYVTVKVDFAFVSAEDGSEHVVTTYGEAMDSGDKATNKAMSAAYKYAAMQAFCIPTEGDTDADSTTHAVKAQPKSISPTAGVRDGLTETEQQFFREHAEEISAFIERGLAADAVAYVQAQGFTAEEFTTVWTYMSAPIRSKYKAAKSMKQEENK